MDSFVGALSIYSSSGSPMSKYIQTIVAGDQGSSLGFFIFFHADILG
jgi:hypothetical protein